MAALLSSPVARCRTKLPIMVAYLDISLKFRVRAAERTSISDTADFLSKSKLASLLCSYWNFVSIQADWKVYSIYHFIKSEKFTSWAQEVFSIRKSCLSVEFHRFSKKIAITSIKNILFKIIKNHLFKHMYDSRYETRLNHRFMCDTSHDMDIIGDVISRRMRSRHPFVSRNTRRAHWSRRARHSPKKNYLCIANISNHDADAGHVILQLQQKRSRSERRLSAFPALFAGTYPPGI